MAAKRVLRSATKVKKLTLPKDEERFEKLIAGVEYARDHELDYARRYFRVPNEILSRLTTASKEGRLHLSRLEDLPQEIHDLILDHLACNDLIMLALSSPTLAVLVKATKVPKHANLLLYRLSRSEYHAIQNGQIPNPYTRLTYTFPKFEHIYHATAEQSLSLRARVATWIGNGYRFCAMCKKFRSRSKAWWNAFAEYESPGVTTHPDRGRLVRKWVAQWCNGRHSTCPVHKLL